MGKSMKGLFKNMGKGKPLYIMLLAALAAEIARKCNAAIFAGVGHKYSFNGKTKIGFFYLVFNHRHY
jgi:hypothetical protein